MPASVLSAFFVFTFITAITPGPNNILALTTGGRAGFRGSIPVLAGICGGFFCVMAICGVLSFSFSVLSASFLQIMRYIGSAYLLWLAWKTAMPKAGGNSDGRADAGFMTGFVLQLVNVKIMVYGMTAYSAFILPHHDSVAALLAGMCFLTMMQSGHHRVGRGGSQSAERVPAACPCDEWIAGGSAGRLCLVTAGSVMPMGRKRRERARSLQSLSCLKCMDSYLI